MKKEYETFPDLKLFEQDILSGVSEIIKNARKKAALFLNSETTMMYWNIGDYINLNLKAKNQIVYGDKILATVSQELTANFGKGFTYSSLTRMCKVATVFDKEIVATLSQQLSWSHLIEMAVIEDDIKREFYLYMNVSERWGVRELRKKIDNMMYERTAVAKYPKHVIQENINKLKQENIIMPDLVFKNSYVLDFLSLPNNYNENELEKSLINEIEKFILELGSGFAFIERQKRISVDSIDYYLDLLFYHRKLQRLIAIDLKIGKFKPEHKAQMELYLRWLEKHEKNAHEEKPIGLLLCSEGNTEHIELLLLDDNEIKVAQYLTELPSKEWFAEKLHRAMEVTKMENNISPG